MKNYIIAAIVSVFFLASCGADRAEEEKFLQIYREILIAREQIADSLKANQRVAEILEKNGYDEPRFRQTFFEFAKDKKRFTEMLDSLRKSVLSDTTLRKNLTN